MRGNGPVPVYSLGSVASVTLFCLPQCGFAKGGDPIYFALNCRSPLRCKLLSFRKLLWSHLYNKSCLQSMCFGNTSSRCEVGTTYVSVDVVPSNSSSLLQQFPAIAN